MAQVSAIVLSANLVTPSHRHSAQDIAMPHVEVEDIDMSSFVTMTNYES